MVAYPKTNKAWFSFIFAASFLLRVGLIVVTPQMNHQIDLNIYVDGGQLVSNNVNPYLFTEGVALRQQLRTDSTAFHSYTCATQSRWDYYASSNLPLSLIFYGAIDAVSTGNAFLYRLVFAFFDALLGLMVILFLIKSFNKKTLNKLSATEKLMAIGFGAVSPTLLFWGVLMPEEKGVQILLMLAALYTARSRRWVLSAICLGFSVTFKGLGVFVAPICWWYVIDRPTDFKGFISKNSLQMTGLYVGLSVLVTALVFTPFLPDVLTMMTTRLDSNINSDKPNHAAIGRIFFALAGDNWRIVKNLFVVFFIAIHLLLFRKRSFSPEVFTASSLLFFVDISLQNGSLDRMNIGFMVAALLISQSQLRYRFAMIGYSVVASSLLFLPAAWAKSKQTMDFEWFDCLFAFGFVVVYTTIILMNAINVTNSFKNNPIKSLHP